LRTTAVFFPFALFGSSGTSLGAELLADAFEEMLADNRRERMPTRARAYTEHVRVRQLPLETLADYQAWRPRGRRTVRQVFQAGDFLLWITGNHLGVLPVYEELGQEAEPVLVIQLDAHLDIYNLSDCTAELSHGNFLLHSDGPLPRLLNVGARDLFLPAEHVNRTYQHVIPAAALALDPERALRQVHEAAASVSRVFLDIDCDVLDPAYFPAVSQPLPFGLSPQQLLRVIEAAWSERLAGIALSEFDPGRDLNDRSLSTLVWLLEYLLLRRYEPCPAPAPRVSRPRGRRGRRS
jgi:arginase family enzyme